MSTNPDIIRLLPDAVANQIAAGEVIQRPASVVKELVENAVDAGATSITIVIKDGGRTLIQVIDNGSGMSPADARMAFERHATSKISTAADLYALHTMGFRGEALPSIASVAQVELRTMRPGDENGTCLRISGSRFEGQEPVAATSGSNFIVRNLLFNQPGRRKFLKKDSVETGHILREFERLALVNPHIDFTLVSNDVTLYQLLHASEKQRIVDLFGKSLDRALLPISTAAPFVRISGFIGLPSAAKKRGFQQFFGVNGRNMRHPFFHRAVMGCYQPLIASDAQPSYFINFEVAPENIDVNVHPQKHEIKFEDELIIRDVLVAAIKESLGRFNVSGAIDFDVEDAPEIPAFDPREALVEPAPAEADFYNPFAPEVSKPRTEARTESRINSAPGGTARTHAAPSDWQKLYESFSRERAAGLDEVRGSALNDAPDTGGDSTAQSSLPQMPAAEGALTRHCMQLRGRYIAMPASTGLMLIDVHRAHVNVLYAALMAAHAGEAPSQRLIFPDTVELTPSQSAAVAAMTDVLAEMGFDISPMGGNAWAVNAVPASVAGKNVEEALAAMADEIATTGTLDPASLRSGAALALARAAAMRAGHALSDDEMEALAADLLRLPSPTYTPDGLRVIATIDNNSIDSLFQ